MLDGVRVIDLSRLLKPMATWYLRGMGAETIKVEDPKIAIIFGAHRRFERTEARLGLPCSMRANEAWRLISRSPGRNSA